MIWIVALTILCIAPLVVERFYKRRSSKQPVPWILNSD
jgi:hypothetical protein